MTAAELIETLRNVPPECEVVVECYDIKTGNDIGPLYTVMYTEPVQWAASYDHSKAPDAITLSCAEYDGRRPEWERQE